MSAPIDRLLGHAASGRSRGQLDPTSVPEGRRRDGRWGGRAECPRPRGVFECQPVSQRPCSGRGGCCVPAAGHPSPLSIPARPDRAAGRRCRPGWLGGPGTGVHYAQQRRSPRWAADDRQRRQADLDPPRHRFVRGELPGGRIPRQARPDLVGRRGQRRLWLRPAGDRRRHVHRAPPFRRRCRTQGRHPRVPDHAPADGPAADRCRGRDPGRRAPRRPGRTGTASSRRSTSPPARSCSSGTAPTTSRPTSR